MRLTMDLTVSLSSLNSIKFTSFFCRPFDFLSLRYLPAVLSVISHDKHQRHEHLMYHRESKQNLQLVFRYYYSKEQLDAQKSARRETLAVPTNVKRRIK